MRLKQRLLITVSGHLLIRADGRISYQKKHHGVTLKTLRSAKQDPLIHFFVCDPNYQIQYAEIGRKERLPSIREFLKRAYDAKHSLLSAPIDGEIIVPQGVVDAFPSIIDDLKSLGITGLKPFSASDSGVSFLRNWERAIKYRMCNHSEAIFEKVAPVIPKIAYRASEMSVSGDCDAYDRLWHAAEEQFILKLGSCKNDENFSNFYYKKVILSDLDITRGTDPNYYFSESRFPAEAYVYSGFNWNFNVSNVKYSVPLLTRRGIMSEDILVASGELPVELRDRTTNNLAMISLGKVLKEAIRRSLVPVSHFGDFLTKLFSLIPMDGRINSAAPTYRIGTNPENLVSDDARLQGFALRNGEWKPKDVWHCDLWWLPGGKFCGRIQMIWCPNTVPKVEFIGFRDYGPLSIFPSFALKALAGAPDSLISENGYNVLRNEFNERLLKRARWHQSRSSRTKVDLQK